MKKAAIIQSNYIPWKGYFDIINEADEFILFDDLQFTQRDWRNRNRIKTYSGSKWLTIPVEYQYQNQPINTIRIADLNWGVKHWKSIEHNYSKSIFFNEYKNQFEELYLNSSEKYISQINFNFIKLICQILEIDTRITFSSEYKLIDGKNEKLIDLCKQLDADVYITGPKAKDYIVEQKFVNENIQIKWADYSNYPEYKQNYPPFDHNVSIVDLIFNVGPNAKNFMKSFTVI